MQKGGQFRWASHYVFLTRALHGEVIGLEALDEREYRIWLGPLALGVLDSCQGAVRAAGNVLDWSRKVSRMYSA